MMCRCCGVIIVPSGGDEAVLVECARTVVALGSPPRAGLRALVRAAVAIRANQGNH